MDGLPRRLLGNKRAGRIENRENTHRLIIISRSNFYFQADKCARGFYVKSAVRAARGVRITGSGEPRGYGDYTGSGAAPEGPRAFRSARISYGLLSRANSPRRVNLSGWRITTTVCFASKFELAG